MRQSRSGRSRCLRRSVGSRSARRTPSAAARIRLQHGFAVDATDERHVDLEDVRADVSDPRGRWRSRRRRRRSRSAHLLARQVVEDEHHVGRCRSTRSVSVISRTIPVEAPRAAPRCTSVVRSGGEADVQRRGSPSPYQPADRRRGPQRAPARASGTVTVRRGAKTARGSCAVEPAQGLVADRSRRSAGRRWADRPCGAIACSRAGHGRSRLTMTAVVWPSCDRDPVPARRAWRGRARWSARATKLRRGLGRSPTSRTRSNTIWPRVTDRRNRSRTAVGIGRRRVRDAGHGELLAAVAAPGSPGPARIDAHAAAVSFRTRSPFRWPWVSLNCLNWSRSRTAADNGAPDSTREGARTGQLVVPGATVRDAGEASLRASAASWTALRWRSMHQVPESHHHEDQRRRSLRRATTQVDVDERRSPVGAAGSVSRRHHERDTPSTVRRAAVIRSGRSGAGSERGVCRRVHRREAEQPGRTPGSRESIQRGVGQARGRRSRRSRGRRPAAPPFAPNSVQRDVVAHHARRDHAGRARASTSRSPAGYAAATTWLSQRRASRAPRPGRRRRWSRRRRTRWRGWRHRGTPLGPARAVAHGSATSCRARAPGSDAR